MARSKAPVEMGQIYSYLKRYQEDPDSRVFAPLAEAYRKAGLLTEAIEIAREGVKKHPQFMGGRVALGRALFDQELYDQVLMELQPVVEDLPDNLVAQRLIAESALLLGRFTEALVAYKMMLYFRPEDSEVGQIIQELEMIGYREAQKTNQEPDFQEQGLETALAQAPEAKTARRIRQMGRLQWLSQRVERYRLLRDLRQIATQKGEQRVEQRRMD